ncbi:hypothetical protein B0O99DRAFT_682476 [Bisporella sp. PMI_857]|nr:hypothetical protein B0O99DRAFT_682476 [Bisporella sp. PMI_857]
MRQCKNYLYSWSAGPTYIALSMKIHDVALVVALGVWFYGESVLCQLNTTAGNCSSLFESTYYAIRSQADADALASCGENLTPSSIQIFDCLPGVTSIDLNWFTSIHGDLYIGAPDTPNSRIPGTSPKSCNDLITLNAPQLDKILGTLWINELPLLSNIEFPLLSHIEGNILISDVPILSEISTPLTNSTDLSPAFYGDEINIRNTGLVNVNFLSRMDQWLGYTPGINIPLSKEYQHAIEIFITDNPQLQNVDFNSSLNAKTIEITNNPQSHVRFSSATEIDNIVISSVAGVDLYGLTSINKRITISDSSMRQIYAPNLDIVGGPFIVRDNRLLEDIYAPLLSKIGYSSDGYDVYTRDALIIYNNPLLHNISHFSSESDFEGKVNISGSFSSVFFRFLSLKPDPYSQQGFFISSTDPSLDCSHFDAQIYMYEWTEQEIENGYSCAAYEEGSKKDVAKHYKPSSKKKPLSRRDIAGIVIGSTAFAIFVVAILVIHYKRMPAIAPETRNLELVESPPNYAAVGKPHEVPPRYEEMQPSESEAEGERTRSAGVDVPPPVPGSVQPPAAAA